MRTTIRPLTRPTAKFRDILTGRAVRIEQVARSLCASQYSGTYRYASFLVCTHALYEFHVAVVGGARDVLWTNDYVTCTIEFSINRMHSVDAVSRTIQIRDLEFSTMRGIKRTLFVK